MHLLDEVNVARPSCGNDMGAPGLGQLHSEGADAPSPCMDQHALALVHSRSLQRLRANSPDALAQLSEHHIGSKEWTARSASWQELRSATAEDDEQHVLDDGLYSLT